MIGSATAWIHELFEIVQKKLILSIASCRVAPRRQTVGDATMAPTFDRVSSEHDLSLLAVDDDADVLRALRRALPNFQVRLASNYAESIDILRSISLDVVISDYAMPGKNGLCVLQATLELQPDATRVLFSGTAPQEIGEAFSTGLLHHFVQKPWGNDLGRVLVNLSRRRARRLGPAQYRAYSGSRGL
jgi:DNA-binding NtrC family response regulator